MLSEDVRHCWQQKKQKKNEPKQKPNEMKWIKETLPFIKRGIIASQWTSKASNLNFVFFFFFVLFRNFSSFWKKLRYVCGLARVYTVQLFILFLFRFVFLWKVVECVIITDTSAFSATTSHHHQLNNQPVIAINSGQHYVSQCLSYHHQFCQDFIEYFTLFRMFFDGLNMCDIQTFK